MTRTLAVACAVLALAAVPSTAEAQAEPLLGQIMCAGFNYPPVGWERLDGRLLPIAENALLYSLLGTAYGGDGVSTFALPDLRGRVLVHDGNGPGLTPRVMGERGGAETHTLTPSQMPAHTHTVAPRASTAAASASSPSGAVPAARPRVPLYESGGGDTQMAPATTSVAGGNQAVPQMPPYLVINCFIATRGVFPQRQ